MLSDEKLEELIKQFQGRVKNAETAYDWSGVPIDPTHEWILAALKELKYLRDHQYEGDVKIEIWDDTQSKWVEVNK